MKKQKGILVLLCAILIILELLPFGVVLSAANAPEAGRGTYGQTYSYFSLQPFDHANFYPLIIALLSCVLLCLGLVYALKDKALGAIGVISILIVILSFAPIVLGLSCVTVVGIAIAVIAFAEAVWSFAIAQTAK